ncbi:MAG TPA: 50S ribosomal protein L13 [Candidatus Latescibacteria bacterium]|nr:50S ribosomal protein L13 [Candidatus Latescibacterota bacterium]
MKTYVVRGGDVERKWFLVDAEGKILGRLATRVAHILRGKHKPIYSPHLDVGDHVVIINADKIRLTGRKVNQKEYYRHTGYPGGLKVTYLSKLLAEKPERVVERAIRGMLPHNRLGRKMFKKLKVYAGAEHPHLAQRPEPLDL